MRRRRLGLVLLLALLAMVALVARCGPGWIASTIAPAAAFDESAVPPAPDYATDAAWLALPGRADEADVALAELPAAKVAEADVFYLHPTSSVAPTWNAPWDDPAVRTASIRGGTLIQASAFNGCCAVFAPSYRQASGVAFTSPSPSGARAVDVAYDDVARAFEEFLRRTEEGRPFVLAGHSQGAILGARLLRDRVATTALRQRLVVAYLIGAPLSVADTGGVAACGSPQEVGCVVAYNARGSAYETGAFEIVSAAAPSEHLCVNPLLGAASAAEAPRTRHGGAVFFDVEHPQLLPAFTAAACRDGRLILVEPQPLPWRGLPSAVLRWVMGFENYHSVELQVFYVDLRHDAIRRVQAHRSPPPPG